MPQIAVFGDSLVHGANDLEGGGWVTRLRLHLMNNRLGDKVYGLGIGGNTTADVLQRFDQELAPRQDHVRIVLFEIGLNDVHHPRKRLHPDQSRQNLARLAEKARSHGKAVGFLSLTPVPAHEQRRHRRFDELIESLCHSGGYLHIPVHDCVEHSDLDDGIHPGAEGHRRIFERVLDSLMQAGMIPRLPQ
jgi:lysophospholipase L1-like esterase